MKNILALTLSLVLILILCASAILPPYNKSIAPSLSLPVAYEAAITALGPATNQFHCISANITTQFRAEGEWYFGFYSTNSTVRPKFIAVEFNGTVIFDNGLR